MKITTANVKSPAYSGQHELYVGTHTGSFKRIVVQADKPHAAHNLQNIAALTKTSRVTALNFGTDTGELLIGRANKFAKIYDASSGQFTGSLELLDAPIVGLARLGAGLVAGIGTGRIQVLADGSPAVLETGDQMSAFAQCPSDRRLAATGGKDRQNALKVWDLEAQSKVFQSKNIANDFLQLEVPVWDTQVRFGGDTDGGSTLLTCSRTGYIRRYDTRAQRRPVVEFRRDAERMAYNSLAAHGDLLFAGSTSGVVRAFDQRRLKVVAHTYKGFAGSIADVCVDETGRYLCSGSLDRYVRVHCVESTALLFQSYVNSKVTKVLMRTVEAEPKAEDDAAAAAAGAEEARASDDDEEADRSDDEERADVDPEYDALFDQMKTVRDGEEQSEDSDDEAKAKPQKKKRKLTGKKPSKK